ncbi:hypothetical protein HU200_007918 [Digitaria exilis]|uniref:Uncharacterized protein n=1 Tax=Digitaria exilis TaxID=1010633 RepID=A0A835FNJ6_9POAL|nr:hypothetical protein HU200_007918 [Digitaria exilis]
MVVPPTQLRAFSLAAEHFETPLGATGPMKLLLFYTNGTFSGFTSDENFKHSWYRKLGSSVGALLIGQAGVVSSPLLRKMDEAEKLFLAALLEAKEGFGLRDPHVASVLNNLAEFYRLNKEYEKAELLYLEAIEILEESFGSNDIRVGTALHSLGICYHLQHKFAQAQTCYEIEGRVMGVGHPEYATTMYLLAKVLLPFCS